MAVCAAWHARVVAVGAVLSSLCCLGCYASKLTIDMLVDVPTAAPKQNA